MALTNETFITVMTFFLFFNFFFYRKQLHQALNCRAIEIKTHSFTENLLFPICPVFAASIHS